MAEKTVVDRYVDKRGNRWEPLKDGGAHKSSNEIEQEIDITRHEMDRTLNALSDKFNPQHFVDDVKRMFQHGTEESRDNLTDMGKRIVDLIGSNPVSSALIGSGLGLLIYKNTGGRRTDFVREEGPPVGETVQRKAGETTGVVQEKAGMTKEKLQRSAESARENVQNRVEGKKEEIQSRMGAVKEKASDTVSGTRQNLAERMHLAKERGNETARQAGEQANTIVNEVRKIAYDNPLAAGAAALAFGMLAGLLFPSTKTEKRTIGEKAAAVEEKTVRNSKETFDTAVNQGKDVAAASADTATQKVQEKQKE